MLHENRDRTKTRNNFYAPPAENFSGMTISRGGDFFLWGFSCGNTFFWGEGVTQKMIREVHVKNPPISGTQYVGFCCFLKMVRELPTPLAQGPVL